MRVISSQVIETISKNLVELFNRYVSAFDSYNEIEALTCYQVPCSLSMPDDLKILNSKQALANEFNDIFGQLRNLAFKSVNAHKASFEIVNPSLIMVIVHWQFYDQTQQMFTDFTALYYITNEDDQLAIASVISHEAQNYIPLSHNLDIHRE